MRITTGIKSYLLKLTPVLTSTFYHFIGR